MKRVNLTSVILSPDPDVDLCECLLHVLHEDEHVGCRCLPSLLDGRTVVVLIRNRRVRWGLLSRTFGSVNHSHIEVQKKTYSMQLSFESHRFGMLPRVDSPGSLTGRNSTVKGSCAIARTPNRFSPLVETTGSA